QAASDAVAAQNAADAAAQDALDAAGLAASKADVLIQDTTPVAEFERANTLWIDTTDDHNYPKRWDGTSWERVTDKEALDAAAAAVAADSKAQAAQDKADAADAKAQAAQSAADSADGKAVAAQQAADDAADIAAGKSNVLVQPNAPAAEFETDTTLWIDTSAGGKNKPKAWDGSGWVVVDDADIQQAAQDAADAQAAADAAAQAATQAQQAADG